jgi:uncharacterized membrane protein
MKLNLRLKNINKYQMKKYNRTKLSYILGGLLIVLGLRSVLIINDLLTAFVLLVLGISVLYNINGK